MPHLFAHFFAEKAGFGLFRFFVLAFFVLRGLEAFGRRAARFFGASGRDRGDKRGHEQAENQVFHFTFFFENRGEKRSSGRLDFLNFQRRSKKIAAPSAAKKIASGQKIAAF